MPSHVPSSFLRAGGSRRWIVIALVLLGLLLGTGAYLAFRWPYKRSAIIQVIEKSSSGTMEIGGFRTTYFPHPGCVAENVVIREHGHLDPPLVVIERLIVQSSFSGMFRKRVALVRAEGMQISVPHQSEHHFKSTNGMVIERFIADNATLRIQPKGKGRGLDFRIHEVELRDVGGAAGMRFHVRLRNPKPPGEVEASGNFGRWVEGQIGQTRVAGEYRFEHADLGMFRGIAGTLSSQGHFDGTLERMGVQGKTETPDFTVTSSRHTVDLGNEFNAIVDAMSGDLALQRVTGRFRRTTIVGKGDIAARSKKEGRKAVLDLCSRNGRIQDLFLLFIKAENSPITGVTNFCAHITIPSGKQRFFKKVELSGDFGVDDSNFTRDQTQENVNRLSAESEGGDDRKAGMVVSSLHGHVAIRQGTAEFSKLTFGIPGALAQMHGSYDLVSHGIDLHGTLKMDSSPSHMVHGPKAVLMKFMDPFFKKSRGSEVPVKITGTYENPSFGLDLKGKKESTASKTLEKMYQHSTKTKRDRQH